MRTRFRFSPAKYDAAEVPTDLQELPAIEDFTVTSTMLAGLKKADLIAKREAEARERAERMTGGTEAASMAGSTARRPSLMRRGSSGGLGGAGSVSSAAAFSRYA